MADSSWTSTWPFPLSFFFFFSPHAAPPHFSCTHTHTHTHMQTGPWGVFSPEDAICTCLFGMQRALPPTPRENYSPFSCLWLYLPPLSIPLCIFVHMWDNFSFCVCTHDLFVCCLPPRMRGCHFCLLFVCCKTGFRVWCWLFLKHRGLILQWWETSCCARQRDHLKSFTCLPAECVNLPPI